jgi:hypothetical protein
MGTCTWSQAGCDGWAPVRGVAGGDQLRVEALQARQLHELDERRGDFADVHVLGPQQVAQRRLPAEAQGLPRPVSKQLGSAFSKTSQHNFAFNFTNP